MLEIGKRQLFLASVVAVAGLAGTAEPSTACESGNCCPEAREWCDWRCQHLHGVETLLCESTEAGAIWCHCGDPELYVDYGYFCC
jgi:hypothetical protein